MTDPLAEALSQITRALEESGIRYVVVGSLSSSARGVYRATADGDILARVSIGQVAGLAAALGPGWYADVEMMERSIRFRRSFNLIHIASAQKIDIFPAIDEFHASQLERATTVPVFPAGNSLHLPVASAEDIVLAKLQWYRAGGEVSDRQWSDITGILATNPELDAQYLDEWAIRLKVKDLLDKSRIETARELS